MKISVKMKFKAISIKFSTKRPFIDNCKKFKFIGAVEVEKQLKWIQKGMNGEEEIAVSTPQLVSARVELTDLSYAMYLLNYFLAEYLTICQIKKQQHRFDMTFPLYDRKLEIIKSSLKASFSKNVGTFVSL